MRRLQLIITTALLALPGNTHAAECLAPGGLFGPCVDAECDDDLVCFSGLAGDVCVLEDIDLNKIPGDVDICRKPVGGTGLECLPFGQGCLITCDNDAQCGVGTVCEENVGACMHPADVFDVKPPPGAELGPCDPDLATGCGYHLDTCVETPDGSMCIRKDHPEWLIKCEADPACVNGQVCAPDIGFCVWPQGAAECLGPGEMYGPCVDNKCDDGLLCMATTQGSICTPGLDVGPEAEACAEQRGVFGLHCSEAWQTCHIPCANDGWCIGGTVCAEDWELCVYPHNDDDVKPPAGETLGPCMGDDMLCMHEEDGCVVSSLVSGNICAPDVNHWWLVPCGEQYAPCPNGQICADDHGVCMWPS